MKERDLTCMHVCIHQVYPSLLPFALCSLLFALCSLWVNVLTAEDQAIFIAICYFPLKGSCYNMAGEVTLADEGVMGLPHMNLSSDDII